jgi:hypothetical protein
VQAFGDVDAVLGQFYDRAVRAAASAARGRASAAPREDRARLHHLDGTRGTVYLEPRVVAALGGARRASSAGM